MSQRRAEAHGTREGGAGSIVGMAGGVRKVAGVTEFFGHGFERPIESVDTAEHVVSLWEAERDVVGEIHLFPAADHIEQLEKLFSPGVGERNLARAAIVTGLGTANDAELLEALEHAAHGGARDAEDFAEGHLAHRLEVVIPERVEQIEARRRERAAVGDFTRDAE